MVNWGFFFFTILERFVCRLAFRLLFSHYIFQFIPNLIQLPFFVPFSLSWWQFFSLYFEFLFRGKFQPSVSRVESLFRVKTWSSPISITIYPSPTVVSFFGLSSSSKLESTRLPFLFGSILSLIGKKDMNADKIQQICNLNKLFPLIFHTDCSVSSVWQLEKQTETWIQWIISNN